MPETDGTFRLVGVDRVLARVRMMPHRVQAAVQSVIATYVYRIQRSAKRNAPVDTGRLRASIVARLMRLAGEVSTNVEYAIYQEKGTYKMDAQPFMGPALEEHREAFLRDLRNAIRQAIRGG